ncbi:MAG: hypothetical protein IJC94_09815 [Oscillospiraceae bacterium]|nr:hypothetical protein [Oscillospiraceae bacterium]
MANNYVFEKHGEAERPSLMWFWGDTLNEEYVVYQIEQFKKAGIDEFYIHPGHGDMGTEYLSDEYNRYVKLACDTAERLGMRYSMYDEFAWSSGTSAGRMMDLYPEQRMTQIAWFTKNVIVGESAEILFKGKVLAVQARYADKEGRREDITDKVKIEYFEGSDYGRVLWENDKVVSTQLWVFCKYYLGGLSMTSVWGKYSTYAQGFTDTMDADAVRKFFEINHEVYRKNVGDRFGKTIKRIFTDETSISDFCSPTTRPYTQLIEDEFYKEYGYKLSDNYIALTNAFETDEDLKVRYHYYKLITKMFNNAYLDQYVKWCRENNLELIGHLSGAGMLYYQIVQHGDVYEGLSRFDYPGMDTILSKGRLANPDWSGYKLVSSIAKFAGKKKTFCETFSGSGWDLTLEDAKRIINRLMMQGVSHILYMGAFYSMNTGTSKNFPVAYPPSHSFQNPLFKYYNVLSDYTAVRASVMSKTTPVGNSLIFLPQIDAWAHVEESRHNKPLQTMNHNCAFGLNRAGLEYDVYFEPLGAEIKAENGKMNVKGYTYDTVIFPHVGCSNQINLDAFAEYAKQGGRLVFLNKFPNKAVDTAKNYDFAELCGLSEEGKNFFANNSEYAIHQEGNVLLINTGLEVKMDKERFYKDLGDFVAAGNKVEAVEAEYLPYGVTTARREAEGIYTCFINNDTAETQVAKLRLHRDGIVSIIDGTVLKAVEVKDGVVNVELPAHDMQILVIRDPDVTIEGLDEDTTKVYPVGENKKLVLDKDWTFEIKKNNALPLRVKYFAEKQPDGTLSEELQKLAETVEVPYGCYEFPCIDEVTFGSGYAAFGRFTIKEMPKALELFSEVDGDGEVWLNGNKLPVGRKVYEYGPHDSIIDIAPYVKEGMNILIMVGRVHNWKMPHKMPWVIVRGDFCLDANDAIVAPKNDVDITDIYTKQGWRYYGGEAVYKNTFTMEEEKPVSVKINVKTNEVVEVVVNGKSAGTCCWAPYEVDITDLCKQGENRIELHITTTLEPTMIIEEIVLISQGFSEFREDVEARTVGILAAPEITITL